MRDTRATAHSDQNGPAEWASQHALNSYSYWPRTAQTAQEPNPILVDKIGSCPATAAAVEGARRAGIKVVWIKMGFQPDLSDLGAEDVPNGFLFLHLGVKDGVLARDQWGTDIVDELTPEDGEPVIYKTRFSAFYRTELDELLRSYGAKHLIITGCTTSICVESTIRDAFFRDYHCILLEDCTAEPMGRNLSRSNHEATVLLVERIFGSVSSSTDFINALQPAGALTA